VSRENVEIARKAIEAWNAGDMSALRDLYDPDAVVAAPSDWVDAESVGRDAIMEQFAQLRGIFGENSSFDRAEMVAEGDYVVVEVDFHGDTRDLRMTNQMVWVYTMRRGLIVKLEYFRSRREAIEAAGIPAD
jgi:ketosteroid isomerase-like protein